MKYRLIIQTGIFILWFNALAFRQCFASDQAGKVSAQLIYPTLVARVYELNQGKLFWFAAGEQSLSLRQELKKSIDSSATLGLNKARYHYAELGNILDDTSSATDNGEVRRRDKILTDIAIAYFKDIYQGTDISSWVSFDEISPAQSATDNDFIITSLVNIRSDSSLSNFIKSLQPAEEEYQLMKNELKDQIQKQATAMIKQLAISLSLFRWIHHFHLDEYIVVNIPSASLRYYKQDSLTLKMRIVAGKPSTKTPRFAAHCNQIILYPYWNVPDRIALNELLPLFKKMPLLIDPMNIQVLDARGNIVDPHNIKWNLYDKRNFPYRFRQSTGCDNALGVLKFNLTDPYSVYLHDTNLKSAFSSAYRYYSHGCIRLEKPLELAHFLLKDQLDSNYLLSCLKDQKPIPVDLIKPVPVFVVYIPVETDEANKIRYYKDVYQLIK